MANFRDDKNTAFVVTSPPLAVAGERAKRHAMCTHKPQAVSERLNLLYFGIITAFDYIENH